MESDGTGQRRRGAPLINPATPVVLHIVLANTRGGTEAIVETVATAVLVGTASRYRHVVAVPEGAALSVRWRAMGITVIEVPALPRFRDWRGARSLVRALQAAITASGASIVHTHGIAGQIHGGRAAARVVRPVVWHVHDCFEVRWTADGVLHRRAAAVRADVILAVSETVATSWRTRVPSDRLLVAHNGVDLTPVAPAERPVAPLVVWCGRLQRWKGTHVFLDVAARVRQACPAAHFAVVGGTLFGLEPDYAADLRRQADHLALADAITWTGQVDDARVWLAAADVVVHTSVSPEPFGLVVAEAMAQARPVVAFAQGGPREQIVHGATGVLVSPGDVAAMAGAIVQLLGNPSQARAWGTAGRHRVVERFSSAAMVERIESAYDRAQVRA